MKKYLLLIFALMILMVGCKAAPTTTADSLPTFADKVFAVTVYDGDLKPVVIYYTKYWNMFTKSDGYYVRGDAVQSYMTMAQGYPCFVAIRENDTDTYTTYGARPTEDLSHLVMVNNMLQYNTDPLIYNVKDFYSAEVVKDNTDTVIGLKLTHVEPTVPERS